MLYPQVADRSVVTDNVAWDVPAAKVPLGWPLLTTGADGVPDGFVITM